MHSTTDHTTFAVGETLDVLGDRVTLLAAGPQTGGTLTAVVVEADPGSGPPPHTHAFSELFYVLEGELEMLLEGEVRTLAAGEAVAAPGGAVHTYRNGSAAPVRFLVVVHPAGIERFFAEVAAAGRDLALVGAAAERHGVHLLVGGPA